FVYTLGEEYLGVNGLFTNLLSMFSLAELGVGTAIIFKLYKPIEEHNESRIIALMKLFKRVYTVIGWVVAGLGLLCIPFLPYIIEDYETFGRLGINPIFVLLLYIFNSASTYWFFAYKQAIVRAHQKTYLLTLWGYGVSIVAAVSQILVLILTRNFILYTAILIASNILRNFIYAWIANKKYPYLKKQTDEKIEKAEIKDLFKDCGALFIYKANYAVVNATDSVIISIVSGLSSVGIYSNYHLLMTNIKNLLHTVFDSIEASIGSIHATGNLEWKRTVFKAVNFTAVVIYGLVGIVVVAVGDDFINLWIGSNYISNSFAINGNMYYYSLPLFLGIELFLNGYTVFLGKIRNSFGLFRQLKFRPILSMIINLVVGIVLTPIIGLPGPVIGTIVASLCTTMIFDPIVIIKNELHTSVSRYFLRNLWYIVITVGAGVMAIWICSFIPADNLLMLAVRAVTCGLTALVVYLAVFIRSEEMRILMSFLPSNIKKKLRIKS
ncbi:MAG: polysaccharide biosynthesis C-terminal domain-containing protein, partial [Ruminococcus sp.]|nr:polysaccharide biosynthesis C-terminal domain-containing protein [Ruminococcus sp.]